MTTPSWHTRKACWHGPNSPPAELPSLTLSGHLTYLDMPSRSICPDSQQTLLAWEPHFYLDCWEALIGIIWGPRRIDLEGSSLACLRNNRQKWYPRGSISTDIKSRVPWLLQCIRSWMAEEVFFSFWVKGLKCGVRFEQVITVWQCDILITSHANLQQQQEPTPWSIW